VCAHVENAQNGSTKKAINVTNQQRTASSAAATNESLPVELLVLNKSEVESLVDERDATEAALGAFRAVGENELEQEHFVQHTTKTNIINTMPAYFKSRGLFGMKQVPVYYEREPDDPLPRIWGSYIVLTDPVNAVPYALMDGTAITTLRTAGGHAVAASLHLARKDSSTLTIIGCGAESRTAFRSLMNHYALRDVRIFDISKDAMDGFISEMRGSYTVPIRPMDSIRAAVEEADLVWMVTSARRSRLLHESWVKPGCFVAGLSGFRDIDLELSAKADKWVLGTHEGDGHIIDRKAPMFPDGLSKDNVYADMGEIVKGAKAGRENDRERIVYTHMGMAGHDVLLAQKAYERAIEKGVGQRIVL
jgi:ornithine cyclodeaminase/alanine dehydrogenase-like protein (mu-crystallin family)